MDEYFHQLEDLKKSYHKDLAYLEAHFADELLTKFTKILENHYNDILSSKLRYMGKYVEFNMQVFGPILASIASIFEGHLYVYQDITIDEDEHNNYYYHTNYLILIASTKIKDNYTKAELEELINTEQVFLIKRESFSTKTKDRSKSWVEYFIKFYTTYNPYIIGDKCLTGLLQADHFPYLKAFVDDVITYRMASDVREISKDELLNLRKEYVGKHVKEINKRTREYDKTRRAEIRSEIAKLNADYTAEKSGRELLLTKIDNCEL